MISGHFTNTESVSRLAVMLGIPTEFVGCTRAPAAFQLLKKWNSEPLQGAHRRGEQLLSALNQIGRYDLRREFGQKVLQGKSFFFSQCFALDNRPFAQ